ncbi:hypothetical protein, partial [Halorubrum sp. Atlit-28R]|uniref:hypothetical protein n=1 Tax=Halorubrum sp. Atlit-28R TaxID=2282129 RepID=UPI001F2E2260
SMTMRWIVQHPYASAAAGAAVALVGTRSAKTAISHRSSQPNRSLHSRSAYLLPETSREVSGTRRTARTRSTDFQANNSTSKSAVLARNLFTGLATAAAMLLRDPRKMQVAANAFSTVTKFVQSRRTRRPNKNQAQVVRTKEL